MTVNFIDITCSGTVHATDSLIIKRTKEGIETSELSGKPKYVQIPKFNGFMSWFGTAKFAEWYVMDYLQSKAAEAAKIDIGQIQDFSDQIAQEVGEKLNGGGLPNLQERGCGIHFTFYEEIDGLWIPELMFITNYSGYDFTGYKTNAKVLQARRQTFHTISGNTDDNYEKHQEPKYRKSVFSFLNSVRSLPYTNGDNFFTNRGYTNAEEMLPLFAARKSLKTLDVLEAAQRKALFAVKFASLSHEMFNTAPTVGGECFSAAVSPVEGYTSEIKS